MISIKIMSLVAVVAMANVWCQGSDDLFYGGEVDDHDEGLGDLNPVLLSPDVKRSSVTRRIDMCLCCARKQLSFCCHACIQRHVSVVSANILDNRDLSLTDRMLSYKLSSLRMSACSCCAQTSNPYSRCCLWCGNMENL